MLWDIDTLLAKINQKSVVIKELEGKYYKALSERQIKLSNLMINFTNTLGIMCSEYNITLTINSYEITLKKDDIVQLYKLFPNIDNLTIGIYIDEDYEIDNNNINLMSCRIIYNFHKNQLNSLERTEENLQKNINKYLER